MPRGCCVRIIQTLCNSEHAHSGYNCMANTDFECHSPFTFHIHGSAHSLAWSPCLVLVPGSSCWGIPELRRITYFGNSYKDNWKMLTSQLVNKSAFRCGLACGPTCLFTTKQSWSWSTVGSKKLDANNLPSSIKVHPTGIPSDYREFFFSWLQVLW